MKKLSILFVIFATFLMFTSIVAAKPTASDLFIKSVLVDNFVESDYNELFVRVSMLSYKKIKDISVKVYLDGYYLYNTNEFDLNNANGRRLTKSLFIELPENLESGYHFVKVVIQNDYIRKVKYRYIWVE